MTTPGDPHRDWREDESDDYLGSGGPSVPDSADAESTAVFERPDRPAPQEGERAPEGEQPPPAPGGTPPYPGWEETAPPQPGGPASAATTPSRYEQPHEQHEQPYEQPYGAVAPDSGPVPGTTPSSPYGGPPGGGPTPYVPGGPYGGSGPYAPGGAYGTGYPPATPYQPGPQAKPGNGLATASLVLGVASPFLVFVCFTGLLTAILSIVFGAVALSKGVGKGRAVAGIVISVLALVLFAIVAVWFWNVVQECGGLPADLADQCFQRRFPWMRPPG
ncbi:hypothetical protein ACWGH8_08380 [Nonomuraea muscovyensis]|uniref:DUF4190 domain-containing protein n=1 Tax=Nonomuraea muscovyensis TaxID=1124761 RepID=A0A7X0BZ26_9ACTN|nr:DUF4190 domain-containing protein [Nonomuraea muscovyensis]MBB6345445.1 hypothetical protein [Nonomuraea muscovyensis]